MDKKDVYFLCLTLILLLLSAFLFYSYHAKDTGLKIAKRDLIALQEMNNRLDKEIESYKLNKNPNSKDTCFDSEGEVNSSKYGYIEYKAYDSYGSLITTSDPGDVCVDAIIHSEFKENVLREYYCDPNNKPQYEHIVCPNYCKDGVCY